MRCTPVPTLARLAAVLVFAALLSGGCASLPPGPIEAVAPASTGPRQGRVYLLRGWNGLWSEGIDGLAAELRAGGVDAHVYQQGQAAALGDAILARYAGAARREPLVLIGFSFGADESIRIARRLDAAGLPVDLLVTLDPVTPPAVPRNVRACENFYQSNGAWDAFPWLRGVAVTPDGAATHPGRVVNTDLRGREDLLEPDTGHSTIAANAKVHRAILERVLSACAPR